MIKKLGKSIREYKKYSVLTPLFVIVEVIFEVVIPFMISNIIDFGINKEDLEYIVRMGIFVLLMAAASLFFGVMSGRFCAKAAAGFSKNLRNDMFDNIQKFSFSNIDKFTPASLVTRMTTDVTNVQNAYMMLIRVAIRSPIMLLFAMIMAFGVNANLALIYLCLAPLLGVALFFIAAKAFPYFERVFKRYDRLNTVVQENVTNVRVVKAYVREEEENKKFKEISSDVYTQFRAAEKIVAWNSPVMQFAVYTCIILISWFASHYIVQGTMTTGQLTSMIVYATQILSSLMMLSMVYVMLLMARSSAERIYEVLTEKSSLTNCDDCICEVADGSVEFENVNFAYSDKQEKYVLSDVNLKIKSGEVVGIIGGTGSSKSSLVSLIPRLYDVSEGCVKVGGVDVRKYDLKCLRDQVAVVLQKNVLFSGTIAQNLRWGNEKASNEELVRVCKLAQADSFIKEFPEGYETYIEQGGTNVSGGQKQRLCIARALLKKPKILILDDSTSAVDTKTDALIRTAFKEEIPDTTTFIIAQRISSVEGADKIIVLDGGKVVGFGTPKEMLETNEIYRDIYYTQNRGGEEDVAKN